MKTIGVGTDRDCERGTQHGIAGNIKERDGISATAWPKCDFYRLNAGKYAIADRQTAHENAKRALNNLDGRDAAIGGNRVGLIPSFPEAAAGLRSLIQPIPNESVALHCAILILWQQSAVSHCLLVTGPHCYNGRMRLPFGFVYALVFSDDAK